MKRILASLIIAAALWAAISFRATAQELAPGCPDYNKITERLAAFGEGRIGSGVNVRGRRLELWARPDGRSWTVLIRLPTGGACIADFGIEWRPAPGEGA